jgi:hypothetical protein
VLVVTLAPPLAIIPMVDIINLRTKEIMLPLTCRIITMVRTSALQRIIPTTNSRTRFEAQLVAAVVAMAEAITTTMRDIMVETTARLMLALVTDLHSMRRLAPRRSESMPKHHSNGQSRTELAHKRARSASDILRQMLVLLGTLLTIINRR